MNRKELQEQLQHAVDAQCSILLAQSTADELRDDNGTLTQLTKAENLDRALDDASRGIQSCVSTFCRLIADAGHNTAKKTHKLRPIQDVEDQEFIKFTQGALDR